MSINYLITGANRGIGLALTAEVLRNKEKVISRVYAESPVTLINLCRDWIDPSECKPQSLAELRKADVTVEKDLINASKNIEHLDVLVCNAGIMGCQR